MATREVDSAAKSPEFQRSSAEITKAKYNLDGVADDDDGVEDIYSRANASRPGFTKFDQKDMYRMGRIQELKRSYRPLSALSFAIVLTAVWEFIMIANTQGLTDGGLAGVFWSYIWTFVGFSFVIASLAEMASMAPISGGQYHWVSEFAPPKYQKLLSYITGWMSTLAWQAGNASGNFLSGTIIQALITVNNPNYEPKNWHGTLLVFATTTVIFVVNIWGAHVWPKLQNGLMVLHVATFFIVIIVLWAVAPHQSASAVFTEFTNEGGWPTLALCLMVGQITSIFSLLGCDATAHMSEEVRDASRYVPIAIFWSYIGNGLMAIAFLVSFLFAIDNVDNALADPSGYPFIYVFSTCLSTAGVNGLTSLVFVMLMASNISFNASTARQTFAFARDKGLPFSSWIGHIHHDRQIPANAIGISCALTMLLSLINIGSNSAFNAIISLNVVAIMMTYGCSIGCVLYRRVAHPELLPRARWNLGRYGIAINLLGLIDATYLFFWSFWPNAIPVYVETFNWSVVIFVGVFLLCLVMYAFQGRKVYNGPVTIIRAARLD